MLEPAEALAALSHPVAVISAFGAVEYANPAMLALFGSRPGGRGADAASFELPQALRIELQVAAGRLRARGQRTRFRWSSPEPDTDWFDLEAVRVTDSQIVVTCERVTERVAIEATSLRTRGYLDALLNSLNLGVIGLDAEFRVTFLNHDQATLLDRMGAGSSLLDVVGAPISTVFPLLSVAQWQDAYDRVIGRGEVAGFSRMRWSTETPDTWFSVTVVPLVELSGPVSGGVVVTEDVTRLVQLEQDLFEKERIGLVGQLAVALNHEINNPLTVILGRAQLAQHGGRLSPEVAQAMETIEVQALRIADLTRRLREVEAIHLTEYLKDGPLMVDLYSGGPR